MSLYRIILVDDEEEIREGIKRRIDWKACGFSLPVTAENGKDAIEKAELHRPDVVITDIKMPFMDGLELGKWLYEQMPHVKIVIFSGFDDFEYAQKAIQFNVSEYILKPIKSDELLGTLHKIKQKLDDEYNNKRDINTLRDYYEESLPVLKEQFLTNLVDGKINHDKILAEALRYQIDLKGSFYTLCIAQADMKTGKGLLTGQSELVPLSVKKLIDENLIRFDRFISFIYNDSVAVIAIFKERNDIISLIENFNHICRMAQRYLDISLTIGIGSICQDPKELKRSVMGAYDALDYRLILGTEKVIYIDDIEPSENELIIVDERDKRALAMAVKLGSNDDIRAWSQKHIVNSLAVGLPITQLRIYLVELMAELLSIIRAYKLDVNDIFGPGFDGSFSLSGFNSGEELGFYFENICIDIGQLILKERSNISNSLIENARNFIDENYHNPEVSIELLSSYLHVSPAYFSTLFKRETGMSFINYLTQVRLENAVNLINTTQEKTYEIALKVGYSEPSYFSYVFKKHFGVSPSKYRSSQSQEGQG